MEPEREQQQQFHAAGSETLHPGGGPGRPQQQGRHVVRLERKQACPHAETCGASFSHTCLSAGQSEGTLLATGSYDGFARIWTKDGENL